LHHEPDMDAGSSQSSKTENQCLTAAGPETDRCEANGTESRNIDMDAGGSQTENQFLTAACPETERCEANETESRSINLPSEDVSLLDLSLPHKVDVQKMTDDIGDELVPILRKNYDESEPIKQHLTVRRFLRDCWPHSSTEDGSRDPEEGQKAAAPPKKVPRASLYMHQWLFTASETAVPKLCGEGKCVPLPNAILGEDLLRYWYNKERCHGDSPYQYLFMGNTGTMSKLHKDSGGYLISIAPIVGQKEVVLVHRDDASSLYDLYAKLDRPDLHFYPMLYSTRAWKSIITPGEILIMPQGTYHQCRNVTPCLSYHRFHLDTVNLKAFYESMSEKDCKDHFEILWNVATELFSTVDAFVYDLRSQPSRPPEIPERIHSAVANLRILHKICRAVAMDFEKASDRENASEWNKLVSDVESTLHDFRYRRRDHIPNFRACHDRRDPKKRHAPDTTVPEVTKSRSSRKRHMAFVAAEPKSREETLATDLEFAGENVDGNNSDTCANQQACSSAILDFDTNRRLDDNQTPNSITEEACEQEIPNTELPSNDDLEAGHATVHQPESSTTDQLFAQNDEMNEAPLATQDERPLDTGAYLYEAENTESGSIRAAQELGEAEEHETTGPEQPLNIVPMYEREPQSASGNDVEADLHEMQTQPDLPTNISYPDDENTGVGDPAQSTSTVPLAQVQDA
jgi:Cupin-like domain